MAININRGANVRINRGANVNIATGETYYLKMVFAGPPIYVNTNPLVSLVGDIYSLSDWNTFFDSPAIPFTRVNVDIGTYYTITLYGGRNIEISNQFYYVGTYPSNIVSIEGNSIINLNGPEGTFNSNNYLTSVNLPNVTAVNDNCFSDCNNLISINLPSCTTLGSTTAYDYVFKNITGNTISATFNNYLATNNGGSPDGDIQILSTNNPSSTITYV